VEAVLWCEVLVRTQALTQVYTIGCHSVEVEVVRLEVFLRIPRIAFCEWKFKFVQGLLVVR